MTPAARAALKKALLAPHLAGVREDLRELAAESLASRLEVSDDGIPTGDVAALVATFVAERPALAAEAPAATAAAARPRNTAEALRASLGDVATFKPGAGTAAHGKGAPAAPTSVREAVVQALAASEAKGSN